jgi:hypothetical protein
MQVKTRKAQRVPRSSRSRTRTRTRSSKTRNGKVSFAAKLGAFMLESVSDKIVFSMKGGFTSKHPQVFGVLPYLHMNITEDQFRKSLNESKSLRRKSLSRMCFKKDLVRKLRKVNFSCIKQPAAGVHSLDRGLIDSINNRWNVRSNGQKRVREILNYQKQQVKAKIIPSQSVDWGKGL